MANSEVNEETEFWKSIRKDQQERRAARLPGRQQEILGFIRPRIFCKATYGLAVSRGRKD